MKVLLKAFAVLALAATSYAQQKAPTTPLRCRGTEPKPNTVWQVGEIASTAYDCETPGNRPLNTVDWRYWMHIELGKGNDKHFEYLDTLDASSKVRELRFDWILKDYPPGDDYVVRMFSTVKDDPFPQSPEEADKLPWQYIYPIAIVAKGDDKGVESAKQRFKNGSKDKDGVDKKDAKGSDKKADDSSKTDDNGTGGKGADGSSTDGSSTEGNGADGSGAKETSTDAGDQGNSATSLVVGNSLLFVASAIAGALVL